MPKLLGWESVEVMTRYAPDAVPSRRPDPPKAIIEFYRGEPIPLCVSGTGRPKPVDLVLRANNGGTVHLYGVWTTPALYQRSPAGRIIYHCYVDPMTRGDW